MLLGFAIMTAYIPNVVGAVIPTAWIVMWFVGPILLFISWWRKIEIETNWLGLLFLSYVALSLSWSPHGMFEFLQLLAMTSMFLWASTLKDLQKVTIGLAIGLGISALVAILQYAGFITDIFKITGKPAGLFVNSNIFAETSGMLLVLLMIYKLWWLTPVTLPGLLVSSRAVVLGLGVTFIVWVWSKSKLAAGLITITAIFLIFEIGNFSSISQRLDMWKDTATGLTLFGHGIGSFAFVFPEYNHHLDGTKDFAEYAHNDILQLMFELGIGIAPLIVLTINLLKVDDVHKYSLMFFIIIGLFGFPLHMPVTAFMAVIVAGHLVNRSLVNRKLIYGVRPTISNWLAAEEYSFNRIERSPVSNE